MIKDMTQGHPGKLILGFAVPLLFGNLFQQFYNLMDTLIVGKFLGVTELAAVGATGSVNFLIIGFCTGICSGFAIPISQKFGARDESGMRRYVANSIWISAAFAVVLTVLTVALCRTILIWPCRRFMVHPAVTSIFGVTLPTFPPWIKTSAGSWTGWRKREWQRIPLSSSQPITA